jgi:hypothetical protein
MFSFGKLRAKKKESLRRSSASTGAGTSSSISNSTVFGDARDVDSGYDYSTSSSSDSYSSSSSYSDSCSSSSYSSSDSGSSDCGFSGE